VDLLIAAVRFALILFMMVLFGRVIFSFVMAFSREWRPQGFVLVIAELVFTITDPPLKALRRIIPPLSLGAIRLDLAFLVLFFGCSLLSQFLATLA
jgi:YggT family protein